MVRRTLVLLASCSALVDATTVYVVNLCEDKMTLFSNTALTGSSSSREIASGDSVTLTVADAANAAYRSGASYQATQGEFSNVDSRTWYDISIIPAGGMGPGSCSSLTDCKATTGGVGFNVGMQIIPSEGGGLSSTDSCRVLICLEDGCDDAYQFPDQDARTHSCSADVEFQVVFCPSNVTQSSSDSAAEFWLNLNSSSSSRSDSGKSAGSSGSNSSETVVKSQSDPTPSTSSNDHHLTTNNQSGDSSDSSSTAIIVSSVVGGMAVIVAVAAIAYRRRHSIKLWWQSTRWEERRSSDMLVFVEAKDDVAMM